LGQKIVLKLLLGHGPDKRVLIREWRCSSVRALEHLFRFNTSWTERVIPHHIFKKEAPVVFIARGKVGIAGF